jgi:hypothetical protein
MIWMRQRNERWEMKQRYGYRHRHGDESSTAQTQKSDITQYQEVNDIKQIYLTLQPYIHCDAPFDSSNAVKAIEWYVAIMVSGQ